MNTIRTHAGARAGFSLVEVALAMLVVSVGLMGVFALFPHGTESNRKSIQETQIGLFAEYILNGFRYQAEREAWSDVRNVNAFDISPLGSIYAWERPDGVVAGDTVKSISYRVKLDPNIEEMAFRYELRVGPVAGRQDVKYLLLSVWPGLYGQSDATNSFEFYTEVYNYGGT